MHSPDRPAVLFQMDDEEDEAMSEGEAGHEQLQTPARPTPWHRTGTTTSHTQGPLTREEYHRYCDSALECRLPPHDACRVTSGCLIL